MKITTWNVNGIRAREKNIAAWLEKNSPDLLLMQEIKCEAAAFPATFRRLLAITPASLARKALTVSPSSPSGRSR